MEKLLIKFENKELNRESVNELTKELKDVWTDDMIIEESDAAKKELIQRLFELQSDIKYRDEFDDEVQYSDERSVPTLLVSQLLFNDDGYIRWTYHFLNDDSILTFIEKCSQNSNCEG